MVADRFDRFFEAVQEVFSPEKPDPIASKDDIDQASEMLTFSQFSGYQRLIAYLEKEADRQVPTRPEMVEMISGITRQNTMKEVRDQLRKWVADAQEVMARNRGTNA